ncbi:MAG TPA: FHA domain-containing protein [Myxococcales bacterium]|nr:FHA domain-containing protein [Myxococcales bacterium]
MPLSARFPPRWNIPCLMGLHTGARRVPMSHHLLSFHLAQMTPGRRLSYSQPMVDHSDPTKTVQRAKKSGRTSPLRSILHVLHPTELSSAHSISEKSVGLGRQVDLAVTSIELAHGTVSRRHARMDWDGRRKQYQVTDLGSHNGTFINGTRVGELPVVIGSGSVLRLGDLVCVFEAEEIGAGARSHTVSQRAIPGDSATMQSLRELVAQAAPDPSPVLLIGETGVGKEFVAREVHRLSGRSGPFLALNCAELTSQLIESQLFGHERGSFTGATTAAKGLFRAANGGTLFLDEIGELPLELQPKLLRVLQEGEVRPLGSTRMHKVDVRVLAATNRELQQLVAEERFRRDLYARLALWEVKIPPLRERRADLLQLFNMLHTQWCAERERPENEMVLEPEAVEGLLLHSWPENLRGLDRLVHRLAVSVTEIISLEEVQRTIGEPLTHDSPSEPTHAGDTAKRPAPSKDELVAVMEQFDNSVRAVAKYYDRDRRQIYRWLENHGLR